MLSLFFGARSKNHEYTTVYNGRTFKTRLRQFFRRKTYKKGQIINLGGEDLLLHKFIRYNNIFNECWEVSYASNNFKNLGTFQKWLENEY
jgi:hypothetical protein